MFKKSLNSGSDFLVLDLFNFVFCDKLDIKK